MEPVDTIKDTGTPVEPVVQPEVRVEQKQPASDPPQDAQIVHAPGDARQGGSDEILQVLAMIQAGQLPLTDSIENAIAARMLPPPPALPQQQPRSQHDLLAVAMVLGCALFLGSVGSVLIAKIGDSSRDRTYQSAISDLVRQNSALAKENRQSCFVLIGSCPPAVTQQVSQPEPAPHRNPVASGTEPNRAIAATPPELEQEQDLGQLTPQDYEFYKKSYAYWQGYRKKKRATIAHLNQHLQTFRKRYDDRYFAILSKSLEDFKTTL